MEKGIKADRGVGRGLCDDEEAEMFCLVDE